VPGEAVKESFEEFKKSFAYGSRTDLNFKFLEILSDQDAAQFFQYLLWKLGDAFDDGRLDQIVAHVYEWQVRAYAGAGKRTYPDGPFAPMRKPVSESRLALITSSGHFVDGDDPEPFGVKNMTQQEATNRIADFIRLEPRLSSIPVDTPAEKLMVRHGGYDIRAAQKDPNVVFPLSILLDLASHGRIGELAPEAYSFVGACSQRQLLRELGPQWVKMLKDHRVDAALLVPV